MSADPTTKTALDMVTGALRKLGQYAPGETLAPADANDGLDMFNDMLDLWSNQRLFVYNNTENIVNLVSGQPTYTVGLGAPIFNFERPLRIERAYSRLTSGNGSIDFPCEIAPLGKYTAIGLKTQPGPWPKLAYYDSAYPLATLYMWPVPTSNIEFHLWTNQVFSSLLTLTAPLNVPRGYFAGLQYSLAEFMAPEYGAPVSPDVRRIAKEFRATLKATNANPQPEAPLDAGIVAHGASDASFVIHGGFM